MENPTLPTNWMAPLSNANHVRRQKNRAKLFNWFQSFIPGIRFSALSGAFSWDFL